MNSLKTMTFLMVAIMVLALSGCGGSSSGGTSPFKNTSATVTPSSGATLFGNISTSTGKTGITLTTDRTTVDAINGQVLVTARVVNNGIGVAGVPVAFAIVAPLNGPATIEAGRTTVTTDANGEAITRITTGNTASTTNVIVAATATIGSRSGTANATFQIVRGTGVITMGTLPVKSANIDPNATTSQVFQQQIPIRLTDANGFARVGAPVTLSVYTKSGSSTVAFTQATVNTDASGTAIFDATITMAAPAAGATAVDSIIFKAATADATPIVAYAAGYYSVTSIATSPSQPSIILTTDRTSYDVNNGSVLATAKITRNGAPVAGAPVTFSITAPVNGPATIEAGLTTVTTDSNGIAVTRIATGDVLPITNVILQAAATVGSQTVNATATFQIVPTPITQAVISLKTDRSSVDVNNGQVLVTATLLRNGTPVAGKPVIFSIVAPTYGPAAIEIDAGTGRSREVITDSNGTAVIRVIAGDYPITTNVIVQATSTVSGQTAVATTTFQIIRGGGVIMFTSAAGSQPGSQVNMLEPDRYTAPLGTPSLICFKLIPYKLTDSNSNPRVGVPVTLSVYSISTLNPEDVTIDFLVSKYILTGSDGNFPPPGGAPTIQGSYVAPNPDTTDHNQQTITSDSAGMGIFNTAVRLNTFPLGLTNTVTVVFKAETNYTIPVTAYVGGLCEVKTVAPTTSVVISPAAASFGTATDISFTLSAGVMPYSVSSNNTARVTATLLADGKTVLAHLVDATAWTGAVTISAVDSAGQTTSATVSR